VKRERELPLLGVGLGFGPFVDAPGQALAVSQLVGRMQFVWTRDAEAASFARSAGCNAVVEGSDLCFLTSFQSIEVPAPDFRERASGPRLGIVLRAWDYGRRGDGEVRRWIEVAHRCKEVGIESEFFLFSATRDVVAHRELKEAGEHVNWWDPENMTVMEFSRLIGRCDLILTSRFHGAIFALLMNKPFLAISIEPKLRIAADLLGGTEFLVDPLTDPLTVSRKIVEMMARLPALGVTAARVCAEQTRRADSASVEFATALRLVRSKQ
jgi:polysaccharide pyruvyl transferase WcaK-like protein